MFARQCARASGNHFMQAARLLQITIEPRQLGTHLIRAGDIHLRTQAHEIPHFCRGSAKILQWV
jgi:hypothetical protein